MTEPVSLSPWLLPILLPFALIAVAGVWLVVVWLLALLSGWPALARRYAHDPGAGSDGAQLRGQVLAVGPVAERSITRITPTAEGLLLEVHPLFRFGRPTVLVPWSEIRADRGGRVPRLRLGAATTLRIAGRAFRALEPHLRGPA
jgi:hypothetical protein